LRYDVPKHWIKREWRNTYRGQKQIWFLLRLVGRDSDVCLRASNHPEFDAWRWSYYWVPLEAVIEFKRQVYQSALLELSRLLFLSAWPAAGPRGGLESVSFMFASVGPNTSCTSFFAGLVPGGWWHSLWVSPRCLRRPSVRRSSRKAPPPSGRRRRFASPPIPRAPTSSLWMCAVRPARSFSSMSAP
jgi:hypothetical protein